MRIYIRLESSARELDSKILLSMCAAERGANVILGDVTQELLLRWNALPGIFHDHNATPTAQYLADRQHLRKRGFRLTVHDEEHGLQFRDYEDFAVRRFSSESLEQLSALFCWGEFDYRWLTARYPDLASRFVMSGSPRVDLWSDRFSGLYPRSSLPAPLRDEDFVLLVGSMALLGAPIPPSEYLRSWSRLEDCVTPDQFQEGVMRSLQDSVDHVRNFLGVLRHLREAKDPPFSILRPHPTESPEFWKQLLVESPRTIVSGQGAVSALVRHARAVIHQQSTVGYETRTLEKPLITLSPSREDSRYNFLSLGQFVSSPFEAAVAASALCDRKTGPSTIPLSTSEEQYLRERLVRNVGGELASDYIASVWMEILDSPTYKISAPKPISEWFHDRAFKARARIQAEIRNPIGSAVSRTRSPQSWTHHRNREQVFPVFTLESMATTVQAIREATGRFDSVLCRIIAPRVVQFSSRG